MNPSIADLAKTELFRDVPEAALGLVLESAVTLELAPGTVLLTPERDNQHVYLLLAGTLALRFDSLDAPEVRELPAGVSVGEMSVIDDAPPSAYVTAKGTCRVFPIHRELLQRLVADTHPVGRNLLRLMGLWVKANTRHIAEDQSQIQRLAATIRHVTAQGLDRRIPSKPEDRDFAELIDVFNEMLERLERSFKQASRFSGDAAHELRTPLTIMQGQIEQAINQAETGSPIQVTLSGILDEVRRLSAISRKLLLLSQADAGRMPLHRTRFDLTAALLDMAEDARMLAPDLRLSVDVAPGIWVEADAVIRQALHNLISNAIKYNLKDGWIRISTALAEHQVTIAVANASAGIADAERGLIFERFYRADPARSRNIDGFGLGLSLSREIARAHGGDLILAPCTEGEVCFTMTLPVAALTNIIENRIE